MVDNLSDRRKFVNDVRVTSVIPVLNALRSIVLVMLIAKTMGPTDLGIWGQLSASLAFLGMFATMNLGHSMSRFLPSVADRRIQQDDLYSILAMVTAVGITIALTIVVFSKSVSMLLFGSDNYASIVVLLGAWLVVDSTLAEQHAFLRAIRANSFWLYSTLLRVGIELPVVWVVVLKSKSIALALVAAVSVEAFAVMVTALMIGSRIGMKWPRFQRIEQYLRFGLSLIPIPICYWMLLQSHRFLVAHFLGLESAGIYSAIVTITNVFVLITSPLQSVLLPDLSRLRDTDAHEELHLRFRIMWKLVVSVGLVIALPIVMAPDFVLGLVTSGEFVKGNQALVVAVVSMVLYTGFSVASILLTVSMHTRVLATRWAIMTLIAIGIALIAIPKVGLLAPPLALGVSVLWGTNEMARISKKVYSAEMVDIRHLIVQLIAFVGCAAILTGFANTFGIEGVARFLIGAIGSCILLVSNIRNAVWSAPEKAALVEFARFAVRLKG